METTIDRQLDSHLFNLLVSPLGQDALAQIVALDPTPAESLSVSKKLRKGFPPEIVAAALTLHDLRRHACSKFDRTAEMYFTREGLEQSTSERIAVWRAKRYAGMKVVADLCCGIGGDLIALAQLPGLERLIAADLDPDHLAMAIANAHIHAPELAIDGRWEDVRTVDLTGIDGLFIDPARRNERGRTLDGGSEPPLDWVFGLDARVPAIGVKTAPGIPHDVMPDGWELETVAIGHDLKEAALWSPVLATAWRRATIVTEHGVETMSSDRSESLQPRPEPIEPAIGMWLHDPNPAVTRAGLVQQLANDIGGSQIDEQIAFLLTSDRAPSPFTRSLPIIASAPWNEKHLRQLLRDLDAGAMDIRRRGLAGDVDAIGKRLRQKGSRPVMLAMTRHLDKPWAIICDDVPAERS